MKLLIFDTETTGLPKHKNEAYKGPNNWPHIVSISWVILDTDTNIILRQKTFIVKPEWTIPTDSTKIHGITTEYAQRHGVKLDFVINEFLGETYDVLVAHNMKFDLNVILNAILWDLKIPSYSFPNKICTMELSKDLCKLSGKYGYKYPKLKELYFHAFQRMPDEAKLHGSLYDVLILTELIQNHSPLRQAMGLTARNLDNNNGIYQDRTMYFNFTEDQR
jgi:DNA polymerase-3 subunit epsilon